MSERDHPAAKTGRPAITQAMIDAYDDYTHLTLDRRAFMERLTRLAGSGAAAAAIAPLLSANSAHAAIVAPDDQRVEASDTVFPGPGRSELNGYLARPAGQNSGLPSVIVIHENRGLNEHIRDVTRRLAVEGFLTFAPDYLSSKGGTPADEDRAREMIGTLEERAIVETGIAAIAFLQSHEASNGNVGAVGFCWGGKAVNDLAVAASSLDAGVAYYGRQPDDLSRVRNIAAPLLLHYAGQDERVNAGIDAYRAALEGAGKSFTMQMYEGAQHAFNNDTSEARYDRVAAELAWRRTIDFLKAELV